MTSVDPFGLGIPIKTVSEAEMAEMPEGTIYVMVRVAEAVDNPVWPALARRRTKTLCDGCDAPCWFDPLSWGRLPAHVQRLCIQCVVTKAAQQ